MARKRKIWRLLAWSIGIGLILLGLVVGTLPLWFPWAAGPIVSRLGFSFETYRATGYTTFEMRGVRGVIDHVEIEADRVEGWLPTRWLWHRLLTHDATRLIVEVQDWEVRISPPAPDRERKADPIDTTLEIIDLVDAILAEVRFWVPTAHVGPGAVDIDGLRIEIEEALWEQGRFLGTVRVPWFDGPTRVQADVEASRQAELRAESEGLGIEIELALVRQAAAWEGTGTIFWEDNRIDIEGRFIQEGWLPASVRIESDQLRMPPAQIGLAGYEVLTGTITWLWDGTQFTWQSSATARPEGDEVSVLRPPVELETRGRGDLKQVRLEALRAGLPGLTLELQDHVALDWSGAWLTDAARVDLRVDWKETPVRNLGGLVEGRLVLKEGERHWPEIEFDLTGSTLDAFGIQIAQARTIGQLLWPQLEVQTMNLRFDAGPTLDAEATVDLAARRIESGRWSYDGGLVRQVLPEGLHYRDLQANGQAQGPWDRLSHVGELRAQEVSVRGLNPAGLRLHWQGEGLALQSIEALWSAGDSQLGLEAAFGVVEWAPVTVAGSIDGLILTKDGRARYRLVEPCAMVWRLGTDNQDDPADARTQWRLDLGAFHWGGPNRALMIDGVVDWPHRGHLTGSVAGLVMADFLDLVPWPDFQVEVRQAELVAGWDANPVSFELNWSGTAVGPEQVPLALRGRVRGDQSGFMIEELAAATDLAPMLTVEGRIPVVLKPGAAAGWVQFDPDRLFDVRATTDATGLITLPVGVMGSIHLRDPSVEFEVRGSVAEPEGRIRAELSGAEWLSETGASVTPALDRVVLEAVLLRERLRLERFDVAIDGQPVQVTGEFPLGEGVWQALLHEGRLPRWLDASAEVRIVGAEVAPFARYLPDLLSSQGRMDLNLVVRPGAILEGTLVITNAATRPLGPLAPIRDIELRVQFDQRLLTIERFSGQIGGQPVGVTGRVELTEQGLPSFDLEVTGRNVPLVQRPGFLLRSDLELRLQSKPERPAQISGTVQLRDGLFMQDIASLIAGRLERPPLRPPYFSVEQPPFADWRLDLRIEGDQFLRVRIPVFSGIISAAGRLRGTLREPLVSGDARIHSGRVIFPFGSLPVDQGYATLGERDPRGPVLAVAASGRNFRYHVRLEIDGPADDLLVQFSSTPPLTSEEILLMLTAGELPQREIVYSKQARVGRLATYLGRELVTRFIGDEMAEQRLIINSGENIAEDGRTTYSIEYRLDPNWSVVGEYDRFNALNAGLKWRIYTR